MNRPLLAVLVAALLFVDGATSAFAGGGSDGPNVIKPYYYRYQGAGTALNTTDQQQLTVYRDQLELQQRALQLKMYQGASRPGIPFNQSHLPTNLGIATNPAIANQNLFQTQSELDRINGLLNFRLTAPQFAPMPSVSPGGNMPLGTYSSNPGMPGPVFHH